jgi:predicted membrane-bound mannosyltransferase
MSGAKRGGKPKRGASRSTAERSKRSDALVSAQSAALIASRGAAASGVRSTQAKLGAPASKPQVAPATAGTDAPASVTAPPMVAQSANDHAPDAKQSVALAPDVERSSLRSPKASALPESPETAASNAYLTRQVVAKYASTALDRVRGLTVEQWLWIAVFVVAALFRFWGLGDKPLHHDESMHAYFSLAFAANPAGYRYDPLLHGPFQFHAEGLMFALILGFQHLFQPHAIGNPWINDTTARFLPALFGMGIVLLPYGLRRDLGRAGALIAAFLLAISPAFVYFSRFLREDIYFNFFMFAMVVAAIRFAHERTMRRFVSLFAATILAYATFEGIYLTLVVFVGYLALLLVWELAYGLSRLLPMSLSERERLFFSRAGLMVLLGGLAGVAALIGLRTLNTLSNAINANTARADVQVQLLEDRSVAILLYASIVVALLVIGTLIWQMSHDSAQYEAAPAYAYEGGDLPGGEADPLGEAAMPLARREPLIERVFRAPGRLAARGREHLSPEQQPFLRLLLGTSWMQWFVAFVVAWMLFAALYWIIPGQLVATAGQGFQQGVGRGLWQGLYYWLQQQQVARGGQPFYYYLLLIPLYEQVAVVFGLAGIVYALIRPNRFRLFLVWWFVVSFGLYSWAGEKMPWLTIQILLPLMLLAAIAINRVLQGCRHIVVRLAQNDVAALKAAPIRPIASVVGAALVVLLLIPTVFNMLTLSQRDAADGPHEMMVYVQTTKDVQLVMNRIAKADQALYGGKHLLRIGVGPGQEWPFYWYLRDYTRVTWEYMAGDPNASQEDVLILDPIGNSYHSDGDTFMSLHPDGYQMHQYKLRSWWDEAYKPPPCIDKPNAPCPPSSNWGSGVGLGPYLSYGPDAAPNARFDLGKASNRVWNWLWHRKALGSTDGSTDFVFIVHNGLPISA